MTAIIVFLLFLAVQLVASLGALLFSNLDKLGTNFPIDQLTVSPMAAGISLLVAEGLLALGLWLWFYKFEFSVRKKSQNNPELLGIFKFHPLKRDLSTRSIRWYHILFAIVGVLQVAIGLSALLENFQLSDNGSQAIFQEMTHNAFCLLLLCVVGPLCEELVFRVGILRPLYRHRVPALLAAGISISLCRGTWQFAARHSRLYHWLYLRFTLFAHRQSLALLASSHRQQHLCRNFYGTQ